MLVASLPLSKGDKIDLAATLMPITSAWVMSYALAHGRAQKDPSSPLNNLLEWAQARLSATLQTVMMRLWAAIIVC